MIIFVFPDEFDGFAKVVATEKGDDLKVVDGEIKVEFNSDGVAEVASLKRFRDLFKPRAKRRSGVELEVFPLRYEDSPDVAVWLLNQPAKEEIYLYVGRRENAVEFYKSNKQLYSY